MRFPPYRSCFAAVFLLCFAAGACAPANSVHTAPALLPESSLGSQPLYLKHTSYFRNAPVLVNSIDEAPPLLSPYTLNTKTPYLKNMLTDMPLLPAPRMK